MGLLKLNNASLLFVSFSLLYLKVASYAALKGLDSKLFGGGNDSNYYHAYAIGEATNAVNYWPVILRFLNEIGLYNRDYISYAIFIMNLSIVPALVHLVSVVDRSPSQQRNFLVSYFVMAAYPTLFFFSLDMYRDLIMVFVFLVSLVFLRRTMEKRFAPFSLLAFLGLCYFGFLFRPYLGAAMLLAWVLYLFYSKASKYFFLWVLLYFIGLMAGQALGVFDAITAYRGVEGFSGGGATMGVGLHGRDPVTFIFLYCYSFISQVFGIFFPNFSSVLVFLAESVPFFLAFYYVIKNRRQMTPMCKYLIVFFIVYTTVWVIGNDNLGTAVRLRMPSYISIFICFLIISQKKRILADIQRMNVSNGG